MPRHRRRESFTGFYHVIAKGINKEFIFGQNREKNYFKRILKEYISIHDVEIYAYCIMSTHVHLIIKSEIQELSMFMAKILKKYAEYYNYKHKRNGHVFQNRFSSECIETEAYYWNCLRYIHLNPQKVNCENLYLKYRYSSIQEYKKWEANLIHENALKLFRKKFEDWEDVENFHLKRQYNIFLDIKEEINQQILEVGWEYLYVFQRKIGASEVEEIIEDRKMREEYKRYLQAEMKISFRTCDRILKNIKKKFIK